MSRIELDPESRTAEARFILLPGMQDALPKSATMVNSEENPNEKGPSGPDMSSLILVAGEGFVGKKKTSKGFDHLQKQTVIGHPSPLRNWNFFPVITLWELPLNDLKRCGRRISPSESIMPDLLQN